MDVHQLKYVVALADEASFSRAAARLGVAQPSLSQQIKKLESDIGRPLFDRLPRRVVPTQAGQRLVERARLILAQLADAQRQVQEGDGGQEAVGGVLSVGAIPTIAPFVLPPVLSRMQAKFPAVELRIVEDVTDRLVEMVASGELDLAILSAHDGGRTVHVERIATEPLWLMVPPGHKLAGQKRVPWARLADERLLVLHEMHCLSGQVTQLCERRHLRPAVVMRGAQLATIAAMVCAGLGVSIVPDLLRARDRTGNCVYVPFADDPPRRDLCVAWSLLRYRTNASRAFVELLTEELTAETQHTRRGGRTANPE
jgi:LysR family hydrogen peroxide-inducible transcriptional activator